MNAILEQVPMVGRDSVEPSSPQVGRTVPVSRPSLAVPAGTSQSDRGSAGPISSIHSSNNPSIHSLDPSIQSSTDPLEDLAQEFAKDSSDVFIKAAINIVSVDFFTVLNRFDTDALSKRLNEKPELYFQLINSFANLMKASLEQQKLEFKQKQAEAKQRERDQKFRARKPILITVAIISSIESTVGRGVPAEPPFGGASVLASQSLTNVATPRESADQSIGPIPVPSVSSVLNPAVPVDPELAQIVADEFAAWEDHHPEDQEALILSPS